MNSSSQNEKLVAIVFAAVGGLVALRIAHQAWERSKKRQLEVRDPWGLRQARELGPMWVSFIVQK